MKQVLTAFLLVVAATEIATAQDTPPRTLFTNVNVFNGVDESE